MSLKCVNHSLAGKSRGCVCRDQRPSNMTCHQANGKRPITVNHADSYWFLTTSILRTKESITVFFFSISLSISMICLCFQLGMLKSTSYFASSQAQQGSLISGCSSSFSCGSAHNSLVSPLSSANQSSRLSTTTALRARQKRTTTNGYMNQGPKVVNTAPYSREQLGSMAPTLSNRTRPKDKTLWIDMELVLWTTGNFLMSFPMIPR